MGKHTVELGRQDSTMNLAMVLSSCYYSTSFKKERENGIRRKE
jgi:hypothetical protein